MMRWYCGVLLGAAAVVAACNGCSFGEPSRSTNALSRSRPCDKWGAIAGDVGCAIPTTCAIEERCAGEAREFLDCVAEDLAQCRCEEGDGDLNCEGAHKPSEGPADCVAEHRALEGCLDGAESGS